MFKKFILGIWNVGIIEKDVKDILDGGQFKIRWLKHGYRDRFFADPFLYDADDKYYYILAEEMPFFSQYGYISLLKVDKSTMRLVEKARVLEDGAHHSYPFVREDKSFIPENYATGECVAYKLDDNNVALKSELVMDKGLIDQTFLFFDGKEWVFATDEDNPLFGLKIFYREIGESEWHEHALNPVKSDIKSSRPGGHFFTVGDKLYRPVQDSEVRYGHKIRIMMVDKLSPTEFSEHEVAVFSAENDKPFNLGLHTFNAEKGFIVVDGYKERHSFIIKSLCVKCPNFMKRISKQ